MFRSLKVKLAVIALAIFALFAVACGPDPYVHACPDEGTMAFHLTRKINTYRSENGVPALYCNEYARTKAKNHSVDMYNHDRLWHTTLENGYPPDYWSWLGENVGVSYWPSGQDDNQIADEIFYAWVNSSSHRAVMLAGRAEWIGVGVQGREGWKMYATLEMGDRA